jgi:hypothetical protein
MIDDKLQARPGQAGRIGYICMYVASLAGGRAMESDRSGSCCVHEQEVDRKRFNSVHSILQSVGVRNYYDEWRPAPSSEVNDECEERVGCWRATECECECEQRTTVDLNGQR